MVLDFLSQFWCSSRLPSSWMMRRDSSLKITEFSGFLKSSRIDFGYELVLKIPHYFLYLAHSLFILQDYIVSNSFNSEVDFRFRPFFNMSDVWYMPPQQFPAARGF